MINYNITLMKEDGDEYEENFYEWQTTIPLTINEIILINGNSYQIEFLMRDRDEEKEYFLAMVRKLTVNDVEISFLSQNEQF